MEFIFARMAQEEGIVHFRDRLAMRIYPTLRLQWTSMIRNLIVPRVLGKTQEDLQPAIELFRALGAASGHECDDGGAHGYQLEAPCGTVEFIAAASAPLSDLAVEVSDADAAWEIVRKRDVKVLREIADAPDGSRFFAVEVSGMKVTFLNTRSPKTTAASKGRCRRRAKVRHRRGRFNSFITERLLDGALLALRQAGAAERRHHYCARAGII